LHWKSCGLVSHPEMPGGCGGALHKLNIGISQAVVKSLFWINGIGATDDGLTS
jgi:hypothetical protein